MPSLVHADLSFPEGPSFAVDGALFVCVRKEGRVLRIEMDGTRSTVLSIPGQPNGTALHRDGRLFVADSRGSRILAVARDGVAETLADGFLGPNDLTFDSEGTLYFTDPGRSLNEERGAVYRLRSSGELEVVAEGLRYPNGLVIAADGRALYVAETATSRVLRVSLGPDAGVDEVCSLRGGLGPDGMALAADGRLCVANHGAGTIAVIDPLRGRVLDELPAGGSRPTNCAFHAGSLFVTEDESAAVWRVDVGTPGALLFHER